MNRSQEEIRLTCENSNSWVAAMKLGNLLGKNRLMYLTYYNPKHKPYLVVFKFGSVKDRQKVENHSCYWDWLVKCKLKPYKPPIGQQMSYDAEKRTIFCFNLSRSYFQTWNDETEEENLTTLKACEARFKGYLNKYLPEQIEEIHLIKRQEKDYARAMTITFKTQEQAAKFVDSDTFIGLTWLLRTNKKYDQKIRVPQCKVCKETNHQAGDRKCRGTPRCPRCAETDHTDINDSRCSSAPYCLTCRELGHSTGSHRCPRNITFLQKKRKELNEQWKIEEQVKNTPEPHKGMHRDMLRTEKAVKNSYASAAGGQTGSTPAPAPLNIPSGPAIDPRAIQIAFIEASIVEAYVPNSFQKNMEEMCNNHGWPKMNHLKPPKIMLETMCKQVDEVARTMNTMETEANINSRTERNTEEIGFETIESTNPSNSQINLLIEELDNEERNTTEINEEQEKDEEEDAREKKRMKVDQIDMEIEKELIPDSPVIKPADERIEKDKKSGGALEALDELDFFMSQDTHELALKAAVAEEQNKEDKNKKRRATSPPGKLNTTEADVDFHAGLHALSQIAEKPEQDLLPPKVAAATRARPTFRDSSRRDQQSAPKEQRELRDRSKSIDKRSRSRSTQRKIEADPIQVCNGKALENFKNKIASSLTQSARTLKDTRWKPIQLKITNQTVYDKLLIKQQGKDANGVYNITAGNLDKLIKLNVATIIKRKDPIGEFPAMCNEVLDVILDKQPLHGSTVYHTVHTQHAS